MVLQLTEDEDLIACTVGGSVPVRFKIDSGADINVVSECDWAEIAESYVKDEVFIYDVIDRPGKNVSAYAATAPLRIKKSFKAYIEVNEANKPQVFAEFFVVVGGRTSLLSKNTSKALKILKIGLEVNQLSQSTSQKKETFPFIPGPELEFDIDTSVTPTKNPYFHVPAAYLEKARERLKEMEEQGIIERVTGAPQWISGVSAVPKGQNDFRLVINMRGPNKAIRRQFYRFPSMDDIRRKLHGARFFTKLDITSAFYHIRLAESSRDMTTFMVEDGMYRFTRLVFGVSCAPEIFQKTMEMILSGIANNIVFLDDILIYADNLETLRQRTAEVLTRLKENNLSINESKCEFEKQSLTFLGFQVSHRGINIDERKIAAVKEFREPTNVDELRSFLGLATFLHSFIPSFADLTKDLWKVTAANAFEWGDIQHEAFKATQDTITECTLTQGFFSDSDRTSLYTDASPYALGAVLAQTNSDGVNRVICCASKTLTATEKRYPQTHREALAIVWAIEHFFYFLMGRRFVLRTDAEGIGFIFNRGSTSERRAVSRADGWALRVSAYDFDVEYVPGKQNIADVVSRLCTGNDGPYTEKEISGEICLLSNELPEDAIFEEGILTAEEIALETEKDDELQEVWTAIESGDWSKVKKSYKTVANDLKVGGKYITKNGSIVIPAGLVEKALDIAHAGHPGMTAMKSIMRSRVWWPSMNTQIEEKVKECDNCLLTSRQGPPVPMRRSELPAGPWQELAVDFNGPHAKFGGVYILVMVDCFSRYLSMSIVKSTDFESVAEAYEGLFKRFGYPQSIKSDNGPPFNSRNYRYFCRNRGIAAQFSTPLHPQQNGMAERYMQVVNKAMSIAASQGSDFRTELAKAVEAHNSASHRVTGERPEELMFSRKIRRNLPLVASTEIAVDNNLLREKDDREKKIGKWRADRKRSAKDSSILPGDIVVILDTQRAKDETRFAPEKYVVAETDKGDLTMVSSEGKIVKRNVTHVKRVEMTKKHCYENGKKNPPQEVQTPAQDAEDTAEDEEDSIPQRTSKRDRKPPGYLKHYVLLAEQND